MLHDTSVNVKIIKLVTGEEIIAQTFSKSKDGKYLPVVKSPLMLVLVKNEKTPELADVSFVPWILGVNILDTEIAINPETIVTIIEPNFNLEQKYNTALNSFKARIKAKHEALNTTPEPDSSNDVSPEENTEN